MQSTDPFSGHPTSLRGASLPGHEGSACILDGYRRRLRAIDRLGADAAQCGVRTDKERDLLVIPEDEVGLLASEEGGWGAFHRSILELRRELPLLPLEAFGFNSGMADPFEAPSARLRRLGGGVEAIAFLAETGSVYKFFLLKEGRVGATFEFTEGATGEFLVQATAVAGSYRLLLEKLRLIHLFGMPTEVMGITPEGILVVKQTLGRALPEKTDVSGLDPTRLVPVPSRFLRANRDHPRLAFLDGEPWLVADTHDRNVVIAEDNSWRVIDLVAAPLPSDLLARLPQFRDWIERARLDPRADVLAPVDDDEL